jgi:hypothetical protein
MLIGPAEYLLKFFELEFADFLQRKGFQNWVPVLGISHLWSSLEDVHPVDFER